MRCRAVARKHLCPRALGALSLLLRDQPHFSNMPQVCPPSRWPSACEAIARAPNGPAFPHCIAPAGGPQGRSGAPRLPRDPVTAKSPRHRHQCCEPSSQCRPRGLPRLCYGTAPCGLPCVRGQQGLPSAVGRWRAGWLRKQGPEACACQNRLRCSPHCWEEKARCCYGVFALESKAQ